MTRGVAGIQERLMVGIPTDSQGTQDQRGGDYWRLRVAGMRN